MISAFFIWWGQQLAELVPARLKAGAVAGDALIAELSGETTPVLTIWLRAGARETLLGSYPCDPAGVGRLRAALPGQRPATVLLRGPTDFLLERQVNLPLAAEPKWRNVLGFEMNRLTPFTPEQLFWDGAIERRDPVRGLTIRLSMIQKSKIAPAIEALHDAGITPAAIEIARGDGGRRVISLFKSATGVPIRASRLVDGVCAALAVIAVALPFILQWQRGMTLARLGARLRPEVMQVEALRQRGAANAAGAGVFASARAKIGDPLAVLAAVTQALPNNSYITEMTLNHLQLIITGESGSAAALLPALSAYPLLANVAFSAPVTRDSASHQDLFSIQADLLPR